MFRPDPKKKAQMEQGLKHEFMWDCLMSEALLLNNNIKCSWKATTFLHN